MACAGHAQRARLGLEREVVLTGFVPDAVRCLPAFDVVLNTSRHEGLSIATLEALAIGLPVVASAVGGQGEVAHDALRLIPVEADDATWADALEAARTRAAIVPGGLASRRTGNGRSRISPRHTGRTGTLCSSRRT